MDKIIRYYSVFDEWGRLDREPIEFIVNSRFIRSNLPEQGLVLDIGAGPGKYAFALARWGYDVTVADFTPALIDQAEKMANELGLSSKFNGFHVADARDLSRFEEEQFDACLMLGPMYHLQSKEERIQAVNELRRVTRKDGVVFVAFMPRLKHLATSLMYPEHWKPNDTVRGLSEFAETGIIDHKDEGRFTGAYYSRIEDIQPFMADHGFESIKLIASESIVGSMSPEQWDYWRQKGDEDFEAILRLVVEASESPYSLGASAHLMYIGRKR
ncbi:class I SAM-dependent methyltransferase [Cohnella lupini]|uniref:Methyltransferase family protein n=1 Tax=Cohnella lupini TaxID=1294267 RepID=A0A3D9IUB9_9BACL|nr:class I SAM-dependent methyltransferase [Cohnella lupini]RED65109.1 methyltransferase family protein [Cohnella lupini]